MRVESFVRCFPHGRPCRISANSPSDGELSLADAHALSWDDHCTMERSTWLCVARGLVKAHFAYLCEAQEPSSHRVVSHIKLERGHASRVARCCSPRPPWLQESCSERSPSCSRAAGGSAARPQGPSRHQPLEESYGGAPPLSGGSPSIANSSFDVRAVKLSVGYTASCQEIVGLLKALLAK